MKSRPKKTHPLLVSQACQAKLGMTKRVRDGSITLDDYDALSLEVARQVGIGLFMIRIDHLIRDDYASNPLWNDLVIDFDDESGVDNVARDSDHSNSSECFHTCDGQFALVFVCRRVCFRLIRMSWALDSRILSGLLGRILGIL